MVRKNFGEMGSIRLFGAPTAGLSANSGHACEVTCCAGWRAEQHAQNEDDTNKGGIDVVTYEA